MDNKEKIIFNVKNEICCFEGFAELDNLRHWEILLNNLKKILNIED